jgi:hypothetical protein
MPQALEVLESDALRAAEVLGLPPAELAERARYDGDTLPGRRSNLGLVLMAIAVAVVLVVAASAQSQAFR